MLVHIKAHSIMVARVAELITRHIRQNPFDLSMELVVAGSLLHDIAKTPCLNSVCRHDREGEKIVLRHGFHEIAEIVAEHVVLQKTKPGIISEKQIVYYADKRINHDQVVSLDERLAYIMERYGRDNKYRHGAILDNFVKCQQLEADIFARLDFQPGDVAETIKSRKSGVFD
ncbi:MAG: HD domain-containing protein [Desulfobulbaceae bacterium]|nr:HD domain-containing protein [Desulfobulbaceae bacterium]